MRKIESVPQNKIAFIK